MEENKPSETDAEDTPQLDKMSEEEFNNEFEESEAGDENVSGGDDTTPQPFITKAQLEKIVGREIKDVDDFETSYKNLKSYVGKKAEDITQEDVQKIKEEAQPVAQAQDSRDGLTPDNLVLEKVTRMEFLSENPDVTKAQYDEFVKPLADSKGVSPEMALETLKPMFEATQNQEKEKNIGVESKNRISTADDKKRQNLAAKARTGDQASVDAYTKEVIVSQLELSE